DMFRTWIINDDGYDRYTHEMRLQSSGDSALEWTVGAFFDETDWKSTPNGQWQYHASDDRSRAIAEYLWGYYWGLGDPTQIGIDTYGDGTKNYNYNQITYNNKETAYFGEIGYTFDMANGQQIELTAGIRNYDLKDDIHTVVSGIWIGPDPIEDITKDGEDGNRYKFSASWMPNDNMTIFAVYSEGYRPGGNNGPNAPNDCLNDPNIGAYVDRYQSDQIDNHEIGIKGLAFKRRFQFSSAIYRIDWTGVQASVYMPTCGFSYTANAASAVSEGVEFESTTLLTDTLQLQVNASYTDSKMTSDVEALGATAGDSMTMVPEYNFYIALDKDVTMWNKEGTLRLDYAGYGEYKSHFNTKDEDISPSYATLNLSGSVQVNDNARVALYLNNVLNEEIITYKRSRYRSNWPLGDNYYYYGDEFSYSLRLDFDF
ncbi:MAG: TonB-dependent receptor, partial [Gammaproteobacteria bacterium]|nr:TonB-dependent receptor [Gammaproteobacteria bacterium]